MADLKNIRQIGSPTDTDKIFIENNAYQRIHRDEFPERRVFVLMGHTECAAAGYSTFVEAVIPVWDISFSRGLPIWNNHVWNEVFQEVKRSFENSVIIGWALDIKGMPPRATSELEALHSEQFGGAHQVLLLMDSLEEEEYFYQNRAGHLRRKEGFYIYFDSDNSNVIPETVWNIKKEQYDRAMEEKENDKEQTLEAKENDERWNVIGIEQGGKLYGTPRARYREVMYGEEQTEEKMNGKWISSFAVIAAVALLIAIIGTAMRQGRISLDGMQKAVESVNTNIFSKNNEPKTQESLSSELEGDIPTILDEMKITDQDSEIVIEEVPSGEIGSN